MTSQFIRANPAEPPPPPEKEIANTPMLTRDQCEKFFLENQGIKQIDKILYWSGIIRPSVS